MELVKTQSFKLATISHGNPRSDKLALLLPGRLDTKDYINFSSHAQALAGVGFYAVAFDPPGTWESPFKAGFTTTAYIQAINELISFYGDRPTLLFGHSRGGQAAFLAGCSNPAVKGIAVVNASYGQPSSPKKQQIIDDYVVDYRDLPPGDRRTKQQKEFHLSLEYFADGLKYDGETVAKKCTKPKLIMHGTRDGFHSLDEIGQIFNEMPEPKHFYQLDTEHDYRLNPEIIEEVNGYLKDFTEDYFK